MKEYEIRKGSFFDEDMQSVVPDVERAEEIERSLRFALRYFLESGKFTGQSAPLPIYAYPIKATDRNPALIVYYTFGQDRVILISVEGADIE